jgi:hypothetical protein
VVAELVLVRSKMVVNTIRLFSVIILIDSILVPLLAQDLDPKDVHVALDQALPIALAKAKRDFPDLEKYILRSVGPKALKGDPNGLCWFNDTRPTPHQAD